MGVFAPFLRKYVLGIFWLVLFTHCFFQFYKLPFVAVSKPLLVPLLLSFLLLHDNNIGRPAGKFIFYVGLFLALFGDVLLISVSDTFFLSGMITFMVMNICYSIAFFKFHSLQRNSVLPVSICILFLGIVAYWLLTALGKAMGAYKVPIMVYMLTVSLMTIAAVNTAGNPQYRQQALHWFIPGAFIFMIENILVAVNKFVYQDKDLFIVVMLSYGMAQFCFVKGIEKAYLREERISNKETRNVG
jgi:uncharacterized membrane protein YhhN